MKILCEITVHNRLTAHIKTRSQQSTLALGYHPPNSKEVDHLFIIHFTASNKTGTRYKVGRNIEKIFIKFVNDGKATISFKQPPHDLMIRCEPIQLKYFLKAFKLAMEGNGSALGLSSLAVTAVPQKARPITKLTITSPAHYPDKPLPLSLLELNINDIRKHSIDSGILKLCNLTVLNMSNNRIEKIPKRLGELPLKSLDMSENCLGKASSADDWGWLSGRVLQTNLRNLNLSQNNLTYFPYKLVKLTSLNELKMKSNALSTIPFAIRRMKSLRTLNLSDNRLESFPNSITRMAFDTVDVSGEHNFAKKMVEVKVERIMDAMRQPRKLLYLAANAVYKKKLKYSERTVPLDVIDVLEESPFCLCNRMTALTSVVRSHRPIHIRTVHLITSESGSILGDSVFCDDFCKSTYLRFIFQCIENFNRIN